MYATPLEMCTCSAAVVFGAGAELFTLQLGHVHYVTLHVTIQQVKHSIRRAALLKLHPI